MLWTKIKNNDVFDKFARKTNDRFSFVLQKHGVHGVGLRKNYGFEYIKRKNTLYVRYTRVQEPAFAVLFALLSIIRDACVLFSKIRCRRATAFQRQYPVRSVTSVSFFSFHRHLQTSYLCLPLFITYTEKKIARGFLPFNGVLPTFTWYTRAFRTYARLRIYNMTFLAKRTSVTCNYYYIFHVTLVVLFTANIPETSMCRRPKALDFCCC